MADEPTPGTDTGADPAAEDPKDPGDKSTPDNAGDEKVTLTKAELDARMAQVRRGVESSISKKFADYDDLKTKAEKLDQLEESQKSEVEKANAKIAALERQYQEALGDKQDNTLRLAIVTEASKRGITGQQVEDAVVLIDRSKLDFDDDGTPKDIAKAMDELLEARPYLKGKAEGPGSADQGARGGKTQLTQEDLKTMSPEAIVKARQEGQLDSLMGVT